MDRSNVRRFEPSAAPRGAGAPAAGVSSEVRASAGAGDKDKENASSKGVTFAARQNLRARKRHAADEEGEEGVGALGSVSL